MITSKYISMLQKVIAFTSEFMGIDQDQLSEHTKIESDVGMAGLDTILFYEAFFTAFKISNPQDFNADLYVTPEVLQPRLLLKSVFSKKARSQLKIRDITLKHLAEVALKREWFEENVMNA